MNDTQANNVPVSEEDTINRLKSIDMSGVLKDRINNQASKLVYVMTEFSNGKIQSIKDGIYLKAFSCHGTNVTYKEIETFVNLLLFVNDATQISSRKIYSVNMLFEKIGRGICINEIVLDESTFLINFSFKSSQDKKFLDDLIVAHQEYVKLLETIK